MKGIAHDNGVILRWDVWCELAWHYEHPSAMCPGEDYLEITEVHEAQLEVYHIERGYTVFYLYDMGSFMDFLDLWEVDMDEALKSWEPQQEWYL